MLNLAPEEARHVLSLSACASDRRFRAPALLASPPQTAMGWLADPRRARAGLHGTAAPGRPCRLVALAGDACDRRHPHRRRLVEGPLWRPRARPATRAL